MRNRQGCSLWGSAHNIYRPRGVGFMVYKVSGGEESTQRAYLVETSVSMSIRMGRMGKKGTGEKKLDRVSP